MQEFTFAHLTLSRSHRQRFASSSATLLLSAFLSGLVALSAVAWADTPTNAENAASLIENGRGVRRATIFGIRVYEATFFTPAKVSTNEQVTALAGPYRLTLKFLRDVSHTDFVDAWRKGLKDNNPIQMSFDGLLNQLVRGVADLREGEVITLTFHERGVDLSAPKGISNSIEDPNFAKAVLRIWFGPKPADQDLQTALLGGSSR